MIEKAKGPAKQMVGDQQLVHEGKRQTGDPENSSPARHSDHGIVQDEKAEDRPKDKERVKAVHKTDGDHAVVRGQALKSMDAERTGF